MPMIINLLPLITPLNLFKQDFIFSFFNLKPFSKQSEFMKTKSTQFAISALLMAVLFVGCRKGESGSSSIAENISEQEKIALVLKDKDWQFIASQQLKFVDKFVNSSVDLENFDFTNQEEKQKVMGETDEQLEENDKLVKEAAQRLQAKYKLFNPGSSNLDPTFRNEETRKSLIRFKEDKNAYDKYKNLLQARELAVEAAGVGDCLYRVVVCVTEQTTINGRDVCITTCYRFCIW
jgi:hypothetical protein